MRNVVLYDSQQSELIRVSLFAASQLIELASQPFLDRVVERISPAGTVEAVGAD